MFWIRCFRKCFKLAHYNKALLKHATLKSTKMACFYYYFSTFSSYMFSPSSFWSIHIPHNAAKTLLKYVNILHNLKQVKGESIHYVKFVVRSMVSFLYYVRYKESNKANLLQASKRLIQK